MQVKLIKARGSFLDLIEATQYQGQGEFYWGGQFLVAPDTLAECAALGFPKGKPGNAKAIVDQALKKVAEAKWPGNLPDGRSKADLHLSNILSDPKACCWTDGNKKEYDGYAGNWALAAKRYKSDGRLLLKDRDNSPIIDPKTDEPYAGKEGRIYSGAYYIAVVNFWAQDNKFGKGMRCELLGVQYMADGDSFGGSTRVSEDAFDSLDEGADAESLV